MWRKMFNWFKSKLIFGSRKSKKTSFADENPFLIL